MRTGQYTSRQAWPHGVLKCGAAVIRARINNPQPKELCQMYQSNRYYEDIIHSREKIDHGNLESRENKPLCQFLVDVYFDTNYTKLFSFHLPYHELVPFALASLHFVPEGKMK